MLKPFLDFIENNSLFKPDDSVLLAVSGGADSVLLLELFHKAGFKFAVAHCNFNLRDSESDEDENFVKTLVDNYDIKSFYKHFQTKAYACEKGISIEMAARELRYEWFHQLLEKEKYDYVATAHHLDDEAETFFINLVRGTGIAGSAWYSA